MIPGGSTVSKCGCEEVNVADYRLRFLLFFFFFVFDNHLPQSSLCLSVFILQSRCLFRSSRSLTVQKGTTTSFTSFSARRV